MAMNRFFIDEVIAFELSGVFHLKTGMKYTRFAGKWKSIQANFNLLNFSNSRGAIGVLNPIYPFWALNPYLKNPTLTTSKIVTKQ